MKLLDRIKEARGYLLTKLNALGSILLAYALLNPSAASDMLNLLPAPLKVPAAIALPILWFLLVQYAKMRAIKKGVADAS